jgi:hypothetical protein
MPPQESYKCQGGISTLTSISIKIIEQDHCSCGSDYLQKDSKSRDDKCILKHAILHMQYRPQLDHCKPNVTKSTYVMLYAKLDQSIFCNVENFSKAIDQVAVPSRAVPPFITNIT